MHLNDIRTLYKFNSWAHHRIFEVMRTVPPEDYFKNLSSSHGSIHGTLVHILSAEELWLKRWKNEPAMGLHQPDEFPTIDTVLRYGGAVESALLEFVEKLQTDQDIYREISFQDLKGNKHTHPLYQMMQHLVNHSSYHRGQLATMLRQINVKPAGTDLINFYRKINSPA